MHTYERQFYAGSFRPHREEAESVLHFFADCLKERGYPHAEQLEQELLSLMESIVTLLYYSAFQKGFLRLETEELQITALAVYNSDEAEDLGVPSLGLLGDPPTEPSFILTLSGDPTPSLVDGNYLSSLKNHQGHLLIKLDLPIRERGSFSS